MLVKTFCAAVNGIEATVVTVEVSMTRGTFYHLTGLADEAVRESHDRIVAALQNTGFKFPVADTTVNMAPADLRKEGSGYDLPLAIGILAASGKVVQDHLHEYMLIGELGLIDNPYVINFAFICKATSDYKSYECICCFILFTAYRWGGDECLQQFNCIVYVIHLFHILIPLELFISCKSIINYFFCEISTNLFFV